MNLDDMDLSPELREKARACTSSEELLALAKKEGYKLSEEELSAVSGGGRCGRAATSPTTQNFFMMSAWTLTKALSVRINCNVVEKKVSRGVL